SCGSCRRRGRATSWSSAAASFRRRTSPPWSGPGCGACSPRAPPRRRSRTGSAATFRCAAAEARRVSLTAPILWASFCRRAMMLLMLSVGEGRYALPADAVSRIVDPEIEEGFRREDHAIVIGGDRLPCLDLHALSGEPRGPRPVYLVLDGVRGRSAVEVDG